MFTEKFPFPVDGKAKFHPISKAVFTVAEEHKAEKEPPSLWWLFKRISTPEAPRVVVDDADA